MNNVQVDDELFNSLHRVARVVGEMNTLWFVLGATARVLLLEKLYGLEPGRATEDVDFAIALKGWDQFDVLSEQMVNAGFIADARIRHRFVFDGLYAVDIVPFGRVAEKDQTIAWPPDATEVMNVRGFKAAAADIVWVLVNGELSVPVVGPAGLMTLKLFAWHDRHIADPMRDAQDIAYILRYADKIIPLDMLWDKYQDEIESTDYELESAACLVLGKQIRNLTSGDDRAALLEILAGELADAERSPLIRDLVRTRLGIDRGMITEKVMWLAKGIGLVT